VEKHATTDRRQTLGITVDLIQKKEQIWGHFVETIKEVCVVSVNK
jgi:hypothetical protein